MPNNQPSSEAGGGNGTVPPLSGRTPRSNRQTNARHEPGPQANGESQAGREARADNHAEAQAEDQAETKVIRVLKRGETDDSGSRIVDIFWVTDRFIIYEAEGQVRYLLPDDYCTARNLRRRIACLGGLRASIEELRGQNAISAPEKKRAAREIAWALADAFEDDGESPSEKPKEVLTRVDARLRSLVKSAYRRKFVLANLAAFALIEALLVLLAVLLKPLVPDVLASLPHYALFGAMGGLGAFLSVMIGIRLIDVNLDLKAWEHVYSGATRIFIGVIGAWVVGLALDSNLIDPTFGSSLDAAAADNASGLPPDSAMFLILAFLAGFSESLVPNLLRKGEQAAGSDDGASAPDEPIVQKMQP